MTRKLKAINSLKAYYSSFIDIIFTDVFVETMIDGCSKEDINYLIEADFSKVEGCGSQSMEGYYRENFLVNLVQITLGNYDVPVDAMVEYLSKFTSIDEVKLFTPLNGNKLLMHRIKNHIKVTFIIDNGETTDAMTVSGDKEKLADVIKNIELSLQDKIITRY